MWSNEDLEDYSDETVTVEMRGDVFNKKSGNYFITGKIVNVQERKFSLLVQGEDRAKDYHISHVVSIKREGEDGSASGRK